MTFTYLARKRKFAVSAFLFAMLCCNLTVLVRSMSGLRKGYQDFTIYYTSGRMLRDGKAANLYDLAAEYRTQIEFATVPDPKLALPFNHPPYEALLFVPFTWLGYWSAYVLWTILNLVMVAVSAVFLRRFQVIRELPPMVLGLACIAFFPIAIGMILGQDIFLLLLLVVLALISLDQGKFVAAGTWLAAGLFRPHVILPLVLLLAVRRSRILVGFIPTALILGGISAMIMGWRWPLTYIHFVSQVEHTWRNNLGPLEAPNLRGLIGYLPGLRAAAPISGWLIGISSLAVLALAIRRIRRANDSASYLFSLCVVTTLLVSYHGLWYDFTLLFPLVLFLLASLMKAEPHELGTTRIVLLFFLFLSPLYLYLAVDIHRFFWFGLLLLGLFARLVRTPAPAGEPA